MKTILLGKRLNIKLYTNKFDDPETGLPISRGRAKLKKLDFGGATEKEAYYNLVRYIVTF